MLTLRFGFGYSINAGLMDNGHQAASVGAGLICVAFSFFCGVLIYRLWSRQHRRIETAPLFVAGLLFLALALPPDADRQAAYELLLTVFLFPLLVWLGASSTATGRVGQVFDILGRASYGIYVLQAPMFDACKGLFGEPAPATPRAIAAGACVVAAILIVTLLADRYIDTPMRKFLTRRVNAA